MTVLLLKSDSCHYRLPKPQKRVHYYHICLYLIPVIGTLECLIAGFIFRDIVNPITVAMN
jgi:hypothetical protein